MAFQVRRSNREGIHYSILYHYRLNSENDEIPEFDNFHDYGQSDDEKYFDTCMESQNLISRSNVDRLRRIQRGFEIPNSYMFTTNGVYVIVFKFDFSGLYTVEDITNWRDYSQ